MTTFRKTVCACCMFVVVLDRNSSLEITTTATHALQMMADRALFSGLETYVVNRDDGKELTQKQLFVIAEIETAAQATTSVVPKGRR